MLRPLRPQADTGAVGQPQAAALGLPRRSLQPFAPPDPLDPLVVHQPARIAQQGRDLALGLVEI
jgi:hypothetical protein